MHSYTVPLKTILASRPPISFPLHAAKKKERCAGLRQIEDNHVLAVGSLVGI